MRKESPTRPAKAVAKSTASSTASAVAAHTKHKPAAPSATAEAPARDMPEKHASSAKASKKVLAAPTAKLPAAPAAAKADKLKKPAPKKPKLVRDSFTFPESDYALFAGLKQRALSAGVEVKKSEILRAAIKHLATLDENALVQALTQVERIKTGRPKK